MSLKNTLFVLILTLSFVPAAIAADTSLGMRDLAVTQMFEYGKSVYDRGDTAQATQIFRRILELDPNFAPAQTYAKRLGIVKSQPVVAKPQVCVVKVEVPVKPVDPNQDLLDEIAQEDQIIGQLINEISALRAPLRGQTP